jgi:glutathione S-transferase
MCSFISVQDKEKAGYLEALPAKLVSFEKFLGSRPWFAGDNITFVDFVMYELLDQHKQMDKALTSKYVKLDEFLDRFEKLPRIEAYMNSNRYVFEVAA